MRTPLHALLVSGALLLPAATALAQADEIHRNNTQVYGTADLSGPALMQPVGQGHAAGFGVTLMPPTVYVTPGWVPHPRAYPTPVYAYPAPRVVVIPPPPRFHPPPYPYHAPYYHPHRSHFHHPGGHHPHHYPVHGYGWR